MYSAFSIETKRNTASSSFHEATSKRIGPGMSYNRLRHEHSLNELKVLKEILPPEGRLVEFVVEDAHSGSSEKCC